MPTVLKSPALLVRTPSPSRSIFWMNPFTIRFVFASPFRLPQMEYCQLSTQLLVTGQYRRGIQNGKTSVIPSQCVEQTANSPLTVLQLQWTFSMMGGHTLHPLQLQRQVLMEPV